LIGSNSTFYIQSINQLLRMTKITGEWCGGWSLSSLYATGASPEAACRTPCETICNYEDADTFAGFKSDGSLYPMCETGRGYDSARVTETSRPEPRSSSLSDADEDTAEDFVEVGLYKPNSVYL
jgi:hypothetical protein